MEDLWGRHTVLLIQLQPKDKPRGGPARSSPAQPLSWASLSSSTLLSLGQRQGHNEDFLCCMYVFRCTHTCTKGSCTWMPQADLESSLSPSVHSASLRSHLVPEKPFLFSSSKCRIPHGLPCPLSIYIGSRNPISTSGMWGEAIPTEPCAQVPESTLLTEAAREPIDRGVKGDASREQWGFQGIQCCDQSLASLEVTYFGLLHPPNIDKISCIPGWL